MSDPGAGDKPAAGAGPRREVAAAGPGVVGGKVRLQKPHACGGSIWTVTRAGADIGLSCDRCGRRVLMPREEFNRRVRPTAAGT